MKNETARREIESLDYYLQNHTNDYSEESHMAMMMAIKALEQIELNPSYNGVKFELEDWYDVPSDEMTPKQARQAVKDLRKKLVEYLEQQPCEDCISREAVMKCFKKWQPYMATRLLDYEEELKDLPSVTPTIPDVENNYNIGYNCGYADAMCDISESEEV